MAGPWLQLVRDLSLFSRLAVAAFQLDYVSVMIQLAFSLGACDGLMERKSQRVRVGGIQLCTWRGQQSRGIAGRGTPTSSKSLQHHQQLVNVNSAVNNHCKIFSCSMLINPCLQVICYVT